MTFRDFKIAIDTLEKHGSIKPDGEVHIALYNGFRPQEVIPITQVLAPPVVKLESFKPSSQSASLILVTKKP